MMQGLQSSINPFKIMCSTMQNPNMFIMPYDRDASLYSTRYETVLSRLEKCFNVKVFDSHCTQYSLLQDSRYSGYKCIAIDSKKPESIRDAIKEALWKKDKYNNNAPPLSEILLRIQNTTPIMFDLSEYGEFVPCKLKGYSGIRTQSFMHKPVFYRYRVDLGKLNHIPHNLNTFLSLLFDNCPNHLFQKSNYRASARSSDELKIKIELMHQNASELICFAQRSYEFSQYKSRHENLQKYFLINDPCTIACEVPLWLEANELQDYEEVFHTNDILTGHVDVLRYEKDGKVGIWDYKPEAATEINASIQVWLYALMLSIRTGNSLQNMVCGYFDERAMFSFSPSHVNCFV